jgi:crotonobetainyl-CoA:carnitine CoA-transferase CaiB-like acyl-CoA transferase
MTNTGSPSHVAGPHERAGGSEPPRAARMLEGLSVVDCAGEAAAMAGRILADLGARVVKVEPPGGHPLRRAEPLGPDGTSLRFAAWAAGCESVVAEGPDDPRLAALLAEAHAVITTPKDPSVIVPNLAHAPKAVWVEVTPFGAEGPRAHWLATDLGIMAATGNLYCTGDPDRPPVRCAEPVAYAHGGPEVAFALLSGIALGRPCRIDVSLQEAAMIASMGWPGRAGRTNDRGRRSGARIGRTREIWPCKDGFVSFGLRGGKARQANLETIARLVTEAGLGTPAITDRDWSTFDHTTTPPEELEAISAPIAAFFLRHTMQELYELACETNLMLAPVNSPRELLASNQLAARSFFEPLGSYEAFPMRFVRVETAGQAQPDESHPSQPGPQRPAPPLGSLTDAEAADGPMPPGRRAESPFRLSARLRERPPVLTQIARGEQATGGAWAGVRILELGSGAAGPIATRYFAEHGALVVRVESRTRPDFLRTYGLRPGNPCGLDGSDMFDALNPAKLSVGIDLKHPEGREAFLRLVGWCDALAENFAPRALRSLGLEFAELVRHKPDLVMVSSCLMGQTGPHRDYPGFGGQGSALAGYNFLTGWPDREPVGPYGTITDSLAPRFAAVALAAGLLWRERTGRGLHLDVSQVECAIWTLAPWVLDYVVNGRIQGRQGNRVAFAVPHGVFPARGEDRFVAVACTDDEQWARLAAHLGIDDPSLATLEARRARVEEIEALVAAYTATRTAEEVALELQAIGVQAVPVADFLDAFSDPQLRHRGHFVELEHPCMGPCGYERNGLRIEGEPAGYDRPSPLLAEHTEEVLGKVLGHDEVGRLAKAGALELRSRA